MEGTEMSEVARHIIAIGGGGFYRDGENLALETYLAQQSGAAEPRVAFLATASAEPDNYLVSFYTAFLKLGCKPSHLSLFKRTPDLRSYLLSQDVIYVGGGNTKSMLAVWRDWDMPVLLREAWQSGIVLAGVSAGAICWFEQGLTDSWAGGLRPLDCLGFIPGSCCPHYDGEAERRPALHRLLASGDIAPAIAIEDWTAVHFKGLGVHRVVSAKAGARAYAVNAVNGCVHEAPLSVEYLDNSSQAAG
jgi:dipeptidase E